MNALNLATTWIDAEIRQGKLMVVLGVLCAISFVILFRCYPGLIRGLAIPAALIVLALGGYGTSLVISRPPQLSRFEAAFHDDPQGFRQAEEHRMLKVKGSFFWNKVIWITLLAICCATLFFVSGLTFKALAVGLALASLCALAIDTALEHRAIGYYEELSRLTNVLPR